MYEERAGCSRCFVSPFSYFLGATRHALNLFEFPQFDCFWEDLKGVLAFMLDLCKNVNVVSVTYSGQR